MASGSSLTKFLGKFSGGVISNFNCVCDWFTGLREFQVLSLSEEDWLLTGSSKVPGGGGKGKRVSALGPETCGVCRERIS